MQKRVVHVFGRKIKIRYADLTQQGLCGCYMHQESIIYINNKLSKADQLSTLIHELGHCMVATLGLSQAQLSMDLEEILVENFANLMTDIFKITPK